MGRRGLGKGLSALIPTAVADADGVAAELVEVPVDRLRPNPRQPRHHFDDDSLAELTESIRALGVLQPVLVRPIDDTEPADGDDEAVTYELIAGERRWRAARRAGLATIPAVVRALEGVVSLEQALVENLQRDDLNPLEQAAAFQQLVEDYELTHDQVAHQVGKSRAAVTNALRLLQLPASVQKLVVDGRLSGGHARALLASPDRAFQESLAKKAADGAMTVRQVESAVRDRTDLDPTGAVRRATPRPLRPAGLLELEELLSSHLDTRVTVDLGARKGRVMIEFADLEDLERIYRAMTTPAPTTERDDRPAGDDGT